MKKLHNYYLRIAYSKVFLIFTKFVGQVGVLQRFSITAQNITLTNSNLHDKDQGPFYSIL